MPLTINVGLSKKLGLPDYGSVGAMCNVAFEADHNLLDRDLEGFQQRVKNAFVACRQAVQDQLARELHVPAGNSNGTAVSEVATIAHGTNGNGHAANGNGHRNGNGNGHGASTKQLDYARQIAKSIQGLGVRRLEALAAKMYGKPLVGLTSLDASGLIDTLKSIKAGEIDLNSVLEGNAV